MALDSLLEILQDPRTRQPLCEPVRYVFGIPTFLKEGDVVGQNAKYQKMYDNIGRFTGSVFWFICRLFRLDMVSKRKELLSELVIRSKDKVLETSIGAGANIAALPLDAEYVGVDISIEMLRACQKYSLLKPYHLQLVHANAEKLPFRDESFDVVFHFGGINFFNDIPGAIREMIRVAKPGAQILIGDETQIHVESWYSKLPFVKKYFCDTPPVLPPMDAIPSQIKDAKLSYKWAGTMYVITFTKSTLLSDRGGGGTC